MGLSGSGGMESTHHMRLHQQYIIDNKGSDHRVHANPSTSLQIDIGGYAASSHRNHFGSRSNRSVEAE